MRRRAKITLWIAVPLLLLLSVLFFPYLINRYGWFHDFENKPFCHKQMTHVLSNWTNEQAFVSFPNIDGDSLLSMGVLAEKLVQTNQVFLKYNYVPGLQGDDPRELVLFYFNKPTRWISHVHSQPKWIAKTWIVVPVDYFGAGYYEGRRIGSAPNQIVARGEQSESLTTEQFTNRLIMTLDYLRTNNRPHWQSVIKEHTAFLELIR